MSSTVTDNTISFVAAEIKGGVMHFISLFMTITVAATFYVSNWQYICAKLMSKFSPCTNMLLPPAILPKAGLILVITGGV